MTPEEGRAAEEAAADRAGLGLVELNRLARIWQHGYDAGFLDAGDENTRHDAPNPYTLGGAHLGRGPSGTWVKPAGVTRIVTGRGGGKPVRPGTPGTFGEGGHECPE